MKYYTVILIEDPSKECMVPCFTYVRDEAFITRDKSIAEGFKGEMETCFPIAKYKIVSFDLLETE